MASVNASLYYEAHVTIDPVFGEQRENAMLIAERHGFRLAELIMRIQVNQSAYGNVVPLLYGTDRVPVTLIDYQDFKSTAETAKQGKGGGSPTTTGYKNLDDDAHMAKDDTFMTGRSRDLAYLTVNLQRLVKDMQDEGYSVRRYKIEDCIVDSQLMDDFSLLGRYARGGN